MADYYNRHPEEQFSFSCADFDIEFKNGSWSADFYNTINHQPITIGKDIWRYDGAINTGSTCSKNSLQVDCDNMIHAVVGYCLEHSMSVGTSTPSVNPQKSIIELK